MRAALRLISLASTSSAAAGFVPAAGRALRPRASAAALAARPVASRRYASSDAPLTEDEGTVRSAELTPRPPSTSLSPTMPYEEEKLSEARQAELSGRVERWRASGPAEPLHFEATLSSDERKFVHAFCEARGDEMSSKSEGKGAERHAVVYNTPVEAGVVGGVGAARREEIAARVEEWAKTKEGGKLHFEPTLTTAEREYVHKVAAKHGLHSKSEGTGEYRGADWHIAVSERSDSDARA
jgi:hypothetical protein